MEKSVKFSSVGVVYGQLWGGGEGTYTSVKLYGDTKEELIENAKKGIENGSLDSGMGYQKLLGCGLVITKHETITFEGKEYVNEDDVEIEVIGDLNETQNEFILENLYHI